MCINFGMYFRPLCNFNCGKNAIFFFKKIRRLLDAQSDPSSPSVVVVSGVWRGGALKPGTEGRVAAAVAVEGEEEEEVRRDVIK